MHARLAGWALLALCACGSDAEQGDGEAAPEEFVALPRDFAGYEKWWNVKVGEGSVADSHVGVHRRVYVNRMPEPTADEFPVGTILVKTGAGGELDGTVGDEVHAMVKRGGDFNAEGSVGWEWFELKKSSSGALGIVWRGRAAPSGEGYLCRSVDADGGMLEVDCNECHLAARQNDFVLGPELLLSTLRETR